MRYKGNTFSPFAQKRRGEKTKVITKKNNEHVAKCEERKLHFFLVTPEKSRNFAPEIFINIKSNRINYLIFKQL